MIVVFVPCLFSPVLVRPEAGIVTGFRDFFSALLIVTCPERNRGKSLLALQADETQKRGRVIPRSRLVLVVKFSATGYGRKTKGSWIGDHRANGK